MLTELGAGVDEGVGLGVGVGVGVGLGVGAGGSLGVGNALDAPTLPQPAKARTAAAAAITMAVFRRREARVEMSRVVKRMVTVNAGLMGACSSSVTKDRGERHDLPLRVAHSRGINQGAVCWRDAAALGRDAAAGRVK
jgi:hypothetical protein